jgi:hypothetical protein
MPELVYKLPVESEKVAEVVEAFPSGPAWWIVGMLYATRELYQRSMIASNTRLTISSVDIRITRASDIPYEDEVIVKPIRSFQAVYPEYNDVLFRKERTFPRVDQIFFGTRMFSSVRFEYVEGEEAIGCAKNLAQECIKSGYKGYIAAINQSAATVTSFTELYSINHFRNEIFIKCNGECVGGKENFNRILNVVKSLELELHEEKIVG